MENQTQNEIVGYVKKLPKEIQDVIFDNTWRERTEEIAKKYSLNQIQTENLLDQVIYILLFLEIGEKMEERLVQELSISRLLADQIVKDLDTRVFQYVVSTIENGKKSVSTPTTQTTPQKEFQKESIGDFFKKQTNLEIRPENLPMVEKQPPQNTAPRYIPPSSAPHQFSQPAKPEIPANLPTSSTPISPSPSKSFDPYREPLQ